MALLSKITTPLFRLWRVTNVWKRSVRQGGASRRRSFCAPIENSSPSDLVARLTDTACSHAWKRFLCHRSAIHGRTPCWTPLERDRVRCVSSSSSLLSAGPWPPRRSRAPLLPLPPCRPAGSRCDVPFSSRWTALVAVQSLHDAGRVRQATLFQRLASISFGGGATTLFAVPSALRLRRRSAGSGGWPWSCTCTTGGGLRLWPDRSTFDFGRRWRATAVALPHRRR